MKRIKSVLVAVDGESKCGKTTVVERIATEAEYQTLTFNQFSDSEILSDWGFSPDFSSRLASNVARLNDLHSFRNIIAISAGNAFRAAALYQALCELDGDTKSEFVPDDADIIRRLLATDGITEVLQNDPNIGRRVSTVAQFAGAQALCGALFADIALEAYQQDGGGNLVIADARDPIGHLLRNNMIGIGGRQIDPTTILPIYIDTPADVAAERMSGDYNDNLAIVLERRLLDASGDELPVVRPDGLVDDFQSWTKSLAAAWSENQLAPTFCLDNGRQIQLDNIQYLGGVVAALASDTAIHSYANLTASK
jgi:hypothetical protein